MDITTLSTRTVVAYGLFVLLFVACPIYIAAVIVGAFRTGVFPETRFAPPYDRNGHPIRFWFQIIYYSVFALGLAGCGIVIGTMLWLDK